MTSTFPLRRGVSLVLLLIVASLMVGGLAVATSLGASTNDGAVEQSVGVDNQTDQNDTVTEPDSVASGPTLYRAVNNVTAHDAKTGDEIWRFTAPGETFAVSPTVANGTVYAAAEDHLYAIDAATGDEKWTSDQLGGSHSSPTIIDGTVYAGYDDLYALNATTGEEEWHMSDIETPGSPLVVNGTVYAYERSERQDLYAVDADTGSVEWTYDDGRVHAQPTLSDGFLLVPWGFANTPGELRALDPETGTEEWSFELDLGTSVQDSPAVAQGRVIFGGSGSQDGHGDPKNGGPNHLYTISVGAGEEMWRSENHDSVQEPTVSNGTVFVTVDGAIEVFDLVTGHTEWRDSAQTDHPAKTAYDGLIYHHVTTDGGWGPDGVRFYGTEATGDDYEFRFDAVEQHQPTVVNETETGYSVDSSARLGIGGHTETYTTETEFAHFEATTIDVEEPVVGGDPIEANVTVENTGEVTDTRDVEFVVEGKVIDIVEDLELEPGETWSNEFTYFTDSDDEPEVEIGIATLHGTDTATVDVVEPPVFDVSIDDTNAPVGVGDELLVDTTVENVADMNDSQAIMLDIGGTLADAEAVQLDSGEETTITLSYVTETDDLPEVTATVNSDHDEATTTVGVIDSSLPLDYKVGDVEETGELSIVDAVMIQQHLAGLEPEPFDTELADVQRTGEVTVVDAVLLQQYLAGLIDSATADIRDGEAQADDDEIDVTITVENGGGLGTIQPVQYEIVDGPDGFPGTEKTPATVFDVGPDGQEEVTFTVDVEDLSSGTYTLEVYTEDDSMTLTASL